MPKNTRQPSGVVGGSMDVSVRTTPHQTSPLQSGSALASRKHAGVRARKLAQRRRSASRGR